MNIKKTQFGVSTSESCRDGIAMLKHAGADFEVEKRQVSFPTERPAGVTGDGQMTSEIVWTPIDAYAAVRSDTGAPLSHKTIGEGYQVLQNREVIEVVDAICDGHDLNYDFMTSIQGGAGLCVQIMSEDLNEALKVGNDKHQGRLTISNFHDGSGALRVHLSLLRMNCSNVFPALKREFRKRKDHASSYSIKHCKKMEDRINGMIQTYRSAMGDLENTTRILNLLANKKCTVNEQLELFNRLLNPEGPDEIKELSDRAKTGRANKFAELVGLSKQSQNHCEGLEGTWYAAVQPITDYASHGITVKKSKRVSAEEARFTSQYFGAGADFAQAGLELAMEMAGVE